MIDFREFTIQGQSFRIDAQELESIRHAVVEHLRQANDPLFQKLAAELAESIAVVGPEDARLGRWSLVDRDGVLILLRVPPRSAINYLFAATVARVQGKWVVQGVRQERMHAL